MKSGLYGCPSPGVVYRLSGVPGFPGLLCSRYFPPMLMNGIAPPPL